MIHGAKALDPDKNFKCIERDLGEQFKLQPIGILVVNGGVTVWERDIKEQIKIGLLSYIAVQSARVKFVHSYDHRPLSYKHCRWIGVYDMSGHDH